VEDVIWITKKVFYKLQNFIIDVILNCYKLLNRFSSKNILFFDKPKWFIALKEAFKYSSHTINYGTLDDKCIDEYDLIIPLTLKNLTDSNVRNLLKNKTIPIPSMDAILLCDNKIEFNKFMIANGFGSNIPALEKPFTFPYILKKNKDEYSENTFIIYNVEDEQNYAEQLNSADFFSQEIITGKNEYATHINFIDNKIVNSLTVKYIFKSEGVIKGKHDNVIITITYCPYLELFTSILQTIGFNGICCFNYKVKNNVPYILEINPRFGGSLCDYFYLFL
jgi:hypothetical protein